MMDNVDMKVTEDMQTAFYALRDAIRGNACAVYGTKRLSDGKVVGIITGTLEDDEHYIMVPLAVLLLGNDVDEYLGPEGLDSGTMELKGPLRKIDLGTVFGPGHHSL